MWVIRIRKLKRDRKYNDEREKKPNNDGQNIAQKIKDGARPTLLNTRCDLR